MTLCRESKLAILSHSLHQPESTSQLHNWCCMQHTSALRIVQVFSVAVCCAPESGAAIMWADAS